MAGETLAGRIGKPAVGVTLPTAGSSVCTRQRKSRQRMAER